MNVQAAGMEPYFRYKLKAGSLKKKPEGGKVSNFKWNSVHRKKTGLKG